MMLKILLWLGLGIGGVLLLALAAYGCYALWCWMDMFRRGGF